MLSCFAAPREMFFPPSLLTVKHKNCRMRALMEMYYKVERLKTLAASVADPASAVCGGDGSWSGGRVRVDNGEGEPLHRAIAVKLCMP